MVNPTLITIGIASLVGFIKSSVGYIAVIKKEEFDSWKFIQGILVGTVGGGIAGALTQDIKMAIIGALSADDIRSAAINYTKK